MSLLSEMARYWGKQNKKTLKTMNSNRWKVTVEENLLNGKY